MKRFKIPILYLLSFVLSIAPVAIYFLANKERYFVTVPDKVRLSAGLICLCFIVFLKVLGKLRMPSRAVLFGLVCILCYLLERVLNDLLVFSFLALVGEVLDMCCQAVIRREREKKIAEKTACEVVKAINGRV